MAIRSTSVSISTNSNFANKVRSTCNELKQKILGKKARTMHRSSERELAEEDQELLSKSKKKTRIEIEDSGIASYLAIIRKYKVHQWSADRRSFGRAPYDEVWDF